MRIGPMLCRCLRRGDRFCSFALSFLLLLSLATAVESQSPNPPPRRATVLLGSGNSLGWFGGQGEWYFRGDRVSAFGGIGYVPEVEDAPASGLASALGVRGFTAGTSHRAFLELSYSLILTRTSRTGVQEGGTLVLREHSDELYGPGVQVGYQYTAGGGFTVLLSAGAGYGFGDDGNGAGATGGIGFGYTWK